MPSEPPPGTLEVLHTRIRFPEGSRMSRNFRFSDSVDVSVLKAAEIWISYDLLNSVSCLLNIHFTKCLQ